MHVTCCVYCRRYYDVKAGVRARELDVWETAFERQLLRAMAYAVIVVLIAFFAFVDLIFSVKFSATQNYVWVTSIAIGAVSGES